MRAEMPYPSTKIMQIQPNQHNQIHAAQDTQIHAHDANSLLQAPRRNERRATFSWGRPSSKLPRGRRDRKPAPRRYRRGQRQAVLPVTQRRRRWRRRGHRQKMELWDLAVSKVSLSLPASGRRHSLRWRPLTVWGHGKDPGCARSADVGLLRDVWPQGLDFGGNSPFDLRHLLDEHRPRARLDQCRLARRKPFGRRHLLAFGGLRGCSGLGRCRGHVLCSQLRCVGGSPIPSVVLVLRRSLLI